MSGLFYVLSALLIAVCIHHAGKSFRHGRPIDAGVAGATLVLAAIFFMGGHNREVAFAVRHARADAAYRSDR